MKRNWSYSYNFYIYSWSKSYGKNNIHRLITNNVDLHITEYQIDIEGTEEKAHIQAPVRVRAFSYLFLLKVEIFSEPASSNIGYYIASAVAKKPF